MNVDDGRVNAWGFRCRFWRRSMRSKWASAICAFLAVATAGLGAAQGQTPNITRPTSRVVTPVDANRRVALRGNVHPLARPEFDRGLANPALPMNRMVLVLKRSDEQEAALTAFMAEQQNPKSPNFHHWLTAAEFGATYGISDQDLAKVTTWLQSEGFSLDTVSQGRGTIQFSGTAAQVQHTFQTQIHRYVVNGEEHTANNTDPQIPEALTPVIHGIASLHNFSPRSQAVLGGHVKRDTATGKFVSTDAPAVTRPSARAIQPQFSFTDEGAQQEDVTPYDFATIYNLLPLWSAGINGTGETIAISGESSISLADVAAFQSSFGLPNNPPTIILNGGGAGTGAAVENTLDVEWAGAAAPYAKIVLVVSPSTSATNGDLLSHQYIIDNEVASVMSTSFGSCELYNGTAGNAAYNQIFQQGAAEGISIFVAAGDQGSAGCEDHTAPGPTGAITGLQVSGVASSPYVTAVGGTDFNWQPAPANTYWSTTNNANGSSAISYIPEIPWNASCSSTFLQTHFIGESPAEKLCNDAIQVYGNLDVVLAGSGGASSCTTSDGATTASCTGGYPKPVWQAGTGVPNDSHRDIPDVSLFAAGGFPAGDGIPGSAYLICYSSTGHPCTPLTDNTTQIEYQETGGTSVSSPAMAGIMALVNQKTGAAQGLANPILYQLAAAETTLANCDTNATSSNSGCVFYDTTTGNNSVPCITGSLNCITNTGGDQLGLLSGYNATSGYDLATGLGSVNAYNLATHWAAVAVAPTPAPIVVSPATVVSGRVGVAYSAQFSATGGATFPLTFTALGAPDGLTMSSSGLLSGNPTTADTYLFRVTATDSSNAAAGGPFSGFEEVSLTIHPANDTAAVPVITWNPTHTTIFVHAPIGAGVLDATASVPGMFTYTATYGQGNIPITATSELAQQNYTFTANFIPTDTVTYTAASATITVSVINQNVFVANGSGSISSLYPDGTAIVSTPVAGGGIGIALGTFNSVSSADVSGTNLTSVSYQGKLLATESGGGLVSATALATDSEGYIWITNANNSLSEFPYDQPGFTPSTGYTGGSMDNPGGIAIDLAGNIWITNTDNNSVTEILGVAQPTAPIVNTLSAQGERP
jgi:subtilase family serine protease